MVRFTDYSSKMPNLIFDYDEKYYPLDKDLPDPQINPIIPGAKIPLNKVGIGPVDLPIEIDRRDGSTQVLQSQASLYCSLDDPNAKGLNLSRLYILMHEKIKDNLTFERLTEALIEMAQKQNSAKAYCKLRFRYPWIQEALRSRHEVTEWDIDNGNIETLSTGEIISKRKLEGHIAYDCVLEGRYDACNSENPFKFYLTVEYVYSSTCPCSFELAQTATEMREAAANAHSQRSRMTTTIQFDPKNIVWIEDLIELHREYIPTEVQVVVRRRDEQAFAELNGSNLLFSEDAVRLMYQGLKQWIDKDLIYDFSICTVHEESLHPWGAIAQVHYNKDVQRG